jgi:hypothetical protein
MRKKDKIIFNKILIILEMIYLMLFNSKRQKMSYFLQNKNREGCHKSNKKNG